MLSRSLSFRTTCSRGWIVILAIEQLELTKFLPAGGAGRGIPARRAGASPVTSALGAEDGWGNPATGPGQRQLK